MKKTTSIIYVIALILCSFSLKAGDDLEIFLSKREKLFIQYDSLKSQIKDSTWFDIRNLVMVQTSIINEDNFIINDLVTVNDKYDNLVLTHEKLTKQLAENETELTEKSKWVEWGIYAGGALFLLLLVIFVLFIFKILKAGKLKKQNKELEILHVQYQERLEVLNANAAKNPKLSEVEAAYNQIIQENKSNFEKEINESIQKFQDTIKKNEEEILQLKAKLTECQQQNESFKSENKNAEIEYLKNKINDLEKEAATKETDLTEKLKNEKSELASETDSIRRLLEDEKLYNQELKKTIEDFKVETESLKNSLNTSSNVQSDEAHFIEKPIQEIPQDVQVLIDENNTLKVENQEYKKILDEELEFRKDILKLIEELKKLK